MDVLRDKKQVFEQVAPDRLEKWVRVEGVSLQSRTEGSPFDKGSVLVRMASHDKAITIHVTYADAEWAPRTGDVLRVQIDSGAPAIPVITVGDRVGDFPTVTEAMAAGIKESPEAGFTIWVREQAKAPSGDELMTAANEMYTDPQGVLAWRVQAHNASDGVLQAEAE